MSLEDFFCISRPRVELLYSGIQALYGPAEGYEGEYFWLNIKIFIIFDDSKEEEEGRYPPSPSGCLVEGAESRVEAWEISSGVVVSCGELTTPWPRADWLGGREGRTTLGREFRHSGSMIIISFY